MSEGQEPLTLYVSVPIASFRVPQAREYFETLPVPPPSTVYGMLLSTVGERDRLVHEGFELALALIGEPEHSLVLRTLWRVKDRKQDPGLKENRRPDFQELLTGIQILVWVRTGRDAAQPALTTRLRAAMRDPSQVVRFGALSLGESTFLVDELRPARAGERRQARPLVRSQEGGLTLPIWPDHVGAAATRWEHYRLADQLADTALPEEAWTTISRANEA
jgi:CRISPR-associated protein Cas5t